MSVWRKFINVLAPSYARPERRHAASVCAYCGHLDRYHGPDTLAHPGRCYHPVGPDMTDCLCNRSEALTEPHSTLSDEQEFTE